MKYVFRLSIRKARGVRSLGSIVWETDRVAAFAILVTHRLCSIVTLCLLIR